MGRSSAVGLLACLLACVTKVPDPGFGGQGSGAPPPAGASQDDDDRLDEGSSSGGGGDDASSSGEPPAGDATSDAMTSGPVTTAAASTGPPDDPPDDPGPVCGDGTVDPGEACDGLDLAGQDCASQGFTEGVLTCTGFCTFDTSGCTLVCVPAGEPCVGPTDCCNTGCGAGGANCIVNSTPVCCT